MSDSVLNVSPEAIIEWQSASGLPVVGPFFEGDITPIILSQLYPLLQYPFPEEAIQRTKKEETKKGYDTSGIAYQYCVNRMNEVLGPSYWRRIERIIKEETGEWGKYNNKYYDITAETTVEIGNWKDGQFFPISTATGIGGHKGENWTDVEKGAYSNALKKALGFYGVGRQSYEGTLDDDNKGDKDEATDQGTTKSQRTTTTQSGKGTSGTPSSGANQYANTKAANNKSSANPPADNQTGGTSGSIFSGQIILTSNPVKQGAKKAAVKGVLIDEDKECEVCGWASDDMIDKIMGLGSGQVIDVNGAKRQYSTQYGLQITLKKESYKIAS